MNMYVFNTVNFLKKYNKKNIILFLLGIAVFFYFFYYPYKIDNKFNIKFNLTWDSHGYICAPSFKPWDSYRPPAYLLLARLFFSPEDQKLFIEQFSKGSIEQLWGENREIEKLLVDVGLGNSFLALVLIQRIMQALALMIFFWALCLFFPPIPVLISLWLAQRLIIFSNPYMIMSEPLVQAFMLFNIAFLLFFYKYRKFSFLYAACIAAFLGFMLRPAALAFIGTTFLSILFFLKVDKLRHWRQYLTSLGILSLSFFYIGYLSFTAGSLIFGQVSDITKDAKSVYFLEEADIPNMPTYRSTEAAKLLLKEKPVIREKFSVPDLDPSRSLVYKFLFAADRYGINTMHAIYPKLSEDPKIGSLNRLERNKLAIELEKGVKVRHKWNILKLQLQTFINVFGFYPDHQPSSIIRLGGRRLMILSLCAICFAIIIDRPRRFCLSLLFSSHMFYVLGCAIGHIIIQRYMDFSESIFLICIILALWTLLRFFYISTQRFFSTPFFSKTFS